MTQAIKKTTIKSNNETTSEILNFENPNKLEEFMWFLKLKEGAYETPDGTVVPFEGYKELYEDTIVD